jgi:hypothetical protein
MRPAGLALLSLWPVLALAASPRALREDANHTIASALSALQPTVRLDSIETRGGLAVVRLCAASCAQVELHDAEAGCEGGTKLGSLCARVTEGAFDDALRSGLVEALAPVPDRRIWIADEDVSPVRDRAVAVAVAFAFLVAPLLAFATLGRLVRGRRPPVGAAAATVAALIVTAAGAALSIVLVIGLWDALLGAALGGLGLAAGLRAPALGAALRRLALAGAASLLGALALELVTGSFLPRPPAFPPPESARAFVLADAPTASYRFHHSNYKRAVCEATYGNDVLRAYRDLRATRPPEWNALAHRVVHVGDSMVYGLSVTEGETVPAALQRLDPMNLHVNAGIPSIGPDAYWMLARSFLAHRPDLLVVYLFTGNDLTDMDLPYPCSAWGPLLRYKPGSTPVLRLPEPFEWTPVQAGILRWLITQSPPPYPLRVATGWSDLARHATGAFIAAVTRLGTPPFDPALAWSHLEQVMTAIRDDARQADVPLVFVVLPLNFALESADPTQSEAFAMRHRLVAHSRTLGVPVLDPWDVIGDAVRREGLAALFAQAIPYDVHFNARGSRLLAEWLYPQLPTTRPEAKAP